MRSSARFPARSPAGIVRVLNTVAQNVYAITLNRGIPQIHTDAAFELGN
jgi:hypothetical protein